MDAIDIHMIKVTVLILIVALISYLTDEITMLKVTGYFLMLQGFYLFLRIANSKMQRDRLKRTK
jgi:hypothetical protein